MGASESIFALQAPALGLKLITPYSFMKAISEGTEVTAQDTLDHAAPARATARSRSGSTTPRTPRPTSSASTRSRASADIPVATITETLTPAGASFQQWQVAQLQALRARAAPGDGPMTELPPPARRRLR